MLFELELSLEEIAVLIYGVDKNLNRLVVHLALLLLLSRLDHAINDFDGWTVY